MDRNMIIKTTGIVLSCILLTGCQRETEKEGRAESVAASVSEKTAEADASGGAGETGEDIGVCQDRAFNSEKSSIQSEIMEGNFERLDEEEEFRGYIDEYYNMWKDRGIPEAEWQIIDLNGDGIEDLILLNGDTANGGGEKQIIGIFACGKESARCIEWDTIDMTEYSFCGSTGELMYTAPNYGWLVDEEPYQHYYYDKEWNKITDYSLSIIQIDSTATDEEYAKEWKKEHPEFAEDGIYYMKYTESGSEVLTKEELIEIYEEETGDVLYSLLIPENE